MLRISLQTLRANRGTLAGAFVALWLGVTLAYGAGLLMAGALSAPGPGRFAAADAVVQADPSIATAEDESADVAPAPLLDAALVKAFPGGVGDVSFPVGAFDAAGRPVTGDPLSAHGWASAALTPYTLVAGHAPRGAHDVVADSRLPVGSRVRIATRMGEATYRVTGTVRGPAGPPTLFFADAVASRLSGHPDKVNAIAITHLASKSYTGVRPRCTTCMPGAYMSRGAAVAGARRTAAGIAADPRLKVLDRAHAADADASDPRAADRVALVAIFGTMSGICAMVALFVVAGTFSLAIVQRRNEIAVLRALGAAPHQVRRLIAGEALIVSVVAGALGIVAGKPLARAIVDVMADHGAVPPGFAPGTSWIPLVASLGGGVLIAQAAFFAAARRAGRTRPAEALREAAIERARPGVLKL
ncbi:MAG TPA: ABC transporter permease, partial [Solirubrobacter sp.]